MCIQELRNSVAKKEVVWVGGKCAGYPNYGDDIGKGIVVDGSFRNWKDANGNIYLSSWFVMANALACRE
jgi:hypothetical protein